MNLCPVSYHSLMPAPPASPTPSAPCPPLARPRAIVKGDAIGIVSPSSHAPKARWLSRGVKALERAGYPVILDTEIDRFRRFSRIEDERRAENFMGMWLDPRMKAVIGGTGG